MDPLSLQKLFAPFGPIDVRSMFGGQGLYIEGKIFGLVVDGEIFIKVSPSTKPAFAAAGSSPFVYEGKTKPVEMPYWRLPPEALKDPKALVAWAERGLEAAKAAKSSSTTKMQTSRNKTGKRI